VVPSAVAGVLSGETWRSGVLRLHQRAVARAWFATRTEVRPAPSNPLPLGALGLSAARQNIHAQRMAAAAQRIENNMRRALVLIISTFRHLLCSSHCLVVSCVNSAHLPTQQTYLTTTTTTTITPLTSTTTTIVIEIHAHPLHLHHNYVNNHNHHTHNNVYKFPRKIYNI